MTKQELKMMEQRDLRIADYINDLLCSKLMWDSSIDLMNGSDDPEVRSKACESAEAWAKRYTDTKKSLQSMGIPVVL